MVINNEEFIRRMSRVEKEEVYDIYYRLVEKPKDYQRITRKEMAKTIYASYAEDIGRVVLSFDEKLTLFLYQLSKEDVIISRDKLDYDLFVLIRVQLVDYTPDMNNNYTFSLAESFRKEITSFFKTFDVKTFEEKVRLKNALKGYVKSVGIILLDDIENIFVYQYHFKRKEVIEAYNELDRIGDVILFSIDFSDKKGVKALRVLDAEVKYLFDNQLDSMLFGPKPDYKLKDLVQIGEHGYNLNNPYWEAFISASDSIYGMRKELIIEGALRCINYDDDFEDYLDYLEQELNGFYLSIADAIRIVRTFIALFPHAPSILMSGHSRVEYMKLAMQEFSDELEK